MPSMHPVLRGLTLSLTVCGAAAALAASPARADDGVPAPVDPAALLASAGTQAPTAPPTSTAPLDAAADPQAPPQNPVVSPVLPAIPPAVPPPAPPPTPAEGTAPSVSAEVPPAPAPSPDPVPQPAPTDMPAPAPTTPATPATGSVADAGDTGNTTDDNSNDITVASTSIPPQTFVWNWFWNCATDEATPAVTAPPANATVIVLNWHWDCAEEPPPLDVTGVTVCVSCNVAISVRVASPGDSGDLTQSIAASTAAAATEIAGTIEDALQSATAPPPPPPPTPAPAAAAPLQLSQGIPTASPVVYRVDEGIPAAADTVTADELPRHGLPRIGAPAASGATRPKAPRRAAGDHPARSRSPAAGRAAALVRIVVIEHWIEQHETGRTKPGPAVRKARPAAASTRGPVPPAPLLPSLPVPVLAGAGLASAHGGGPGAVAALACGLALLIGYAIFTALRLQPVVPPARGADANPHPPG
jgi:hypothetical protein